MWTLLIVACIASNFPPPISKSVPFLFICSGINYDKPLPPIQVASLRAERIAKEKKVMEGHPVPEKNSRGMQTPPPHRPLTCRQMLPFCFLEG